MPRAPWGRVWLLAIGLAVMALGGTELLRIDEGMNPTAIDDAALWAVYRAQVYGPSSTTVALLGSSRMQEDLSMPEIHRLLPADRVLQLAIDGTDAVGSLRDLAADKRFAGIVICEISEIGLEPVNWHSQDAYVDTYHQKAHWYYLLDRRIEAWLQTHLRFMAPQSNLWREARNAMWNQRAPDAIYITHADRSQDVHYERTDLSAVLAERRRRTFAAYARQPPSDPTSWLAASIEVDKLAQQIEARGGRVAFVRFPTGGAVLEQDERRYPRALYWDKFAAAAHAQTLYFADIAGIGDIPVADESHIGAQFKDAFTDRLIVALAARGVFDNRAN